MARDKDGERPAKRIRVSTDERSKVTGDVITILVGPKQKAYTVHEELARASSPVIDKALTASWVEHCNRTIQFPEDEPATFEIYMHWLYFSTFAVVSYDGSSGYRPLIKAYVLGDKLLDTKFQDAVVDAIVERRYSKDLGCKYTQPSNDTINWLYSHTTSSAPIRQLFVDMLADLRRPPPAATVLGKETSQEFLLQLIAKLYERRTTDKTPLKASDYYRQPTDPSKPTQPEDKSK
ncbi:hypothetical protein BP00DRAFT_395914 [Aspergillus indologenus CBS 114.80]|uniref:BTB domain-containing protein n=1 Tax=Aspergillus indologenus CBS 114.80 TaxID=1450541 RepID=A0A2V5ISV0_9EURO|nr:hypothetical protein BP00DRAFT_395914 [Aspergillus indologenus CBS 114.80]